MQAYLAQNGVKNTSVNANGYLISGTANANALNSMLKTEIHQYKNATGKHYFAPSNEPMMPTDLGSRGFTDCTTSDSAACVRQTTRARCGSSESGSTPKTGTGHSGALAHSDIRAAYNMNTSVNGTGQMFALFELDAYDQSDLTAYESYYNLPNARVTPVSVDGTGTTSPRGGIGEVTLDIELRWPSHRALRSSFTKASTATPASSRLRRDCERQHREVDQHVLGIG